MRPAIIQSNMVYHYVQTNHYNFATLHPKNLKLAPYYSLLYILLYWVECKNQPEAVKFPSKV